ncbi:Microcystin-dependent protein [Spirosomataceae bacterium TFI 002]|nr:Microcystin-dependent protein [Spirosomataceae bacterium TFI 002]
MSDPFLGTVILFAGNFAPRGWTFCDGQLLSINQNQALFSILGTTYGGDGRTTFGLPDLRGRVAIGEGQGPGLTDRNLGERGGSETVQLTVNTLPSHNHVQTASSYPPTKNTIVGSTSAASGDRNVPMDKIYTTESADVSMGETSSQGESFAHNNMQPYLTSRYIIAITGIFPSRN